MEKLTTYFYRNGNTLVSAFEQITTEHYTDYYINTSKVNRNEYFKRYEWFLSHKEYVSHITKRVYTNNNSEG